MKKPIQLLSLLLLFPVLFHAQKSLTGLWTGKLSNDSSTVRKDQAFEIALTQYKQKVYGYSRSAFIVNDTLFYILKRVKGTIDGDVCEIKDDEIISTNFPGRVDKGVHVTTIFRMNKLDTTWHLDGNWQTNKTKNYYSISGKIELQEEPNLDNSKIFPHLEELKVAKDVPFYAATKAAPVTEPTIDKAKEKEELRKRKEEEALAKKEARRKEEEELAIAKAAKKEQEAVAKREAEHKKELEALAKMDAAARKKEEDRLAKKEADRIKEEEAIAKKEAAARKKEEQALAKKESEVKPPVPNTNPVKVEVKAPAVAAAFVTERKTVIPQVFQFKSDSLQLALYDNGEVDGDTVSVLLNGDLLLAKQGLRTIAIKKTIYIEPTVNEITLVLYAENLGKYPPNTGLLVVHDGEEVYQIRFSADLQQNASVVFKRKLKP